MEPKRKRTPRRAASVAAAALAAAPLALGCWDNQLPPRDVPKPEDPRAPAPFVPGTAWSEKSGQSQVFIEGKVVFDTNKAVIRPESQPTLEKLLDFLQKRREVTRLRIEGHTDAQASEEHNQELSQRRALAVADWLVSKGIENVRLIAVGFGESRPLGPNEIAAGRRENRRVEFHVAEVNGRPFLGKDPYAGGAALAVLSLAERKARDEAAARLRLPPPPRKPFVATGDHWEPIPSTPPVGATPEGGAPAVDAAPAEPAKGGGAKGSDKGGG